MALWEQRQKGTHGCHEASLGTEPRQKHTQAPENWATPSSALPPSSTLQGGRQVSGESPPAAHPSALSLKIPDTPVTSSNTRPPGFGLSVESGYTRQLPCPQGKAGAGAVCTDTHTHISAHELCFLTDTGNVPAACLPPSQTGWWCNQDRTTPGQSPPSTLLCTPGAGGAQAACRWCGGLPEKRQGSGLGEARQGPLSSGWWPVLGDRREKNWSSLLVGRGPQQGHNPGAAAGRAPGLWGPQQATLSSRAATRSSNRFLIPEGSHPETCPHQQSLLLQPWATTHLVSIQIPLFRLFRINGIP